ncbi:MAG: LysM peptidoglycan-binding domain-containing protein [Candidatus Daviesbacteria bacterium]|nr:LysM peptidoglycan-binding domain-containing protein [Candidatus Daviesbacteria bacterium]
MPRTTKNKKISSKTANVSLLQRLQSQMQDDQSYLSLILGLLIVLIAGILVFNYFKKAPADLGSAGKTEQTDVAPENLPGQYTVKENDTLFTIAQTYYNDGYKFTEIAKENSLANADSIEVGQVLEIPKLEESQILAEAEITPSEVTPSEITPTDIVESGVGGAINETTWGEKIEGESYTVVEGDWLSKISGRAYGDIMAFDKIAKANNIADPNIIEPGTVLQIPR